MAKTMSNRMKAFWAGVAGVLITVTGSLIVVAVQPQVENVSGAIGTQLNVTTQDQSSCNFVAPSDRAGTIDPDVIGISPAEMGMQPCSDQIAATHGAHDNIVLETVLESANENAIVLTDITIKIRNQTPTTGSAYYSPAGIGGNATTLSALVDVEAASPVKEITVYEADGTLKNYSSMRKVLPRPIATKSDPLVVQLSIIGEKKYTSFDVILHWQSGTTIGESVLDNHGKGFRVAGAKGLPSFDGFDGTWQPAAN